MGACRCCEVGEARALAGKAAKEAFGDIISSPPRRKLTPRGRPPPLPPIVVLSSPFTFDMLSAEGSPPPPTPPIALGRPAMLPL